MIGMLRRPRKDGDEPNRFGAEESGRALDRLVAFSDGVFAIAMTLLVLSLTVPNLSGSTEKVNHELWEALREQWPEVLSYAISFAVIGRYWLIHHRVFRLVRQADAPLLVWNLALLGLIALIPFPTELLGRYGDTTTAVAAYSVTMVLVGLVSLGMTRHIYDGGLLDEKVTDEYKAHSLMRGFLVPIGFALGIPVAFVDPVAAVWTWWISIVVMSVAIRHRYGSAIRHPYATG
jgi:uncharacterized membrane protein